MNEDQNNDVADDVSDAADNLAAVQADVLENIKNNTPVAPVVAAAAGLVQDQVDNQDVAVTTDSQPVTEAAVDSSDAPGFSGAQLDDITPEQFADMSMNTEPVVESVDPPTITGVQVNPDLVDEVSNAVPAVAVGAVVAASSEAIDGVAKPLQDVVPAEAKPKAEAVATAYGATHIENPTLKTDLPDPVGLEGAAEPTVTKSETVTPTPNEIPGVSDNVGAAKPAEAVNPVAEKSTSRNLKSKKFALFGLFGLGALLLIAAATWALLESRKSLSAEQAFKDFPLRALTYKTATQDFEGDLDVAKFELSGDFDFTDPREVKSRANLKSSIKFFVDISYDQDIIHTNGKNFVKVNEYSISGSGTDEESLTLAQQGPNNLKDKWVELNNETEDIANALGNPDEVIQSLNTVLGEIVMGNFDDNQRQNAKEFLDENPVYTYSGEPEEVDLGGVEAFKYNASINLANLKEYNELIAKLVNEELDDSLFADEYKNVRLWLSRESGDVLKVKFSSSNNGTDYNGSVEYSNHNEPVDISEPSVVLSPEDAKSMLLGGAALSGGDEAEQTEDDGDEDGADQEIETDDTIRETNLNTVFAALEIYFNENGKYPTVAEMAQTSWIISNLENAAGDGFIASEQVTDPDGGPGFYYLTTTPGCDNQTVDCVSYVLSADLDSDGRGISDADGNSADLVKESLN